MNTEKRMRNESLFDRSVRALRVCYRVFPVHDDTKLHWINRMAQFWPMRSIVGKARDQVFAELAETYGMEEAAPFPAGTHNELAPERGGRQAPNVAVRWQSGTRAVGYVPYRAAELPDPAPARVIAFYLPQFHPIPENDLAWGKGFTEWRNVARALPQVEAQVQPKLPGELGFYDLRLPEVQERQAELAAEYGIGGFCFHFYWFGGKRLLEHPLRQYVQNPRIGLPFCLCWANENWTKRWDGLDADVIMAQQYSAEDDLAFIAYVATYFVDPRYIRVDGKPLLVVYRPGLFPEPAATAQRWRDYCRRIGVGEILLATTTAFELDDPASFGFDATVEFAPNNSAPRVITDRVRRLNGGFQGNVYDWRSLLERSRKYRKPAWPLYRGVNPGWDNTARKPTSGNVFLHASPRGYEEWLTNAVRDAVTRTAQASDRLVFVNAWNEWAEGACLEPDAHLGYAYLDATRRALQRVATEPANPLEDGRPICVVVHAYYPELLAEILERLRAWDCPMRLIVTTTAERKEAVLAQLDAWDGEVACRVFENRGRDILPFLHVANELADAGEPLVVKLHTKRSLHREDGDVWRLDLLDKLLATENAERIRAAFRTRPKLGMVGPEGHILPLSFYWGSNQANVQYLCRVMGVSEVDPDSDIFCAGSMFWARLDALRPLLDAHLDESLFEFEHGQVDGTLAHAVERSFVPAMRYGDYFLGASDDPLRPAEPLKVDYGYAESSRGPAAV